METVRGLFSWTPKSLQMVTAAIKLKDKRRFLLGRIPMTNLGSVLKSRDITYKGLSSQSYGFSSSHIWMWELDHKEGWAVKSWCFRTVVLEKTLESPLDSKEIKPINSKGNQPWIFIERTDAGAEAPLLRPPDGKNWFILLSLIHPSCWERLRARGEGNNREWDGWANSRR